MEIIKITSQVTALATPIPIPGVGFLPINAFVVEAGGTTVLVDTCITQPDGTFLDGLGGVVDPADVTALWLTHADRDHTGGVAAFLAAAPNAQVLTNFVTMGHLSVGPDPLPMDRVRVVNDGDRVPVGDTELLAFRPPLFDNPGTVGFFDESSGVMISSDFLGGPTGSYEEAVIPDVAAIPAEQLEMGQLVWGSGDSPWVHSVDESKFATSLDRIRTLAPSVVLSTHLPAIHGNLEGHLATLAKLPGSIPFVAPNQEALDALLAEMEPHGA